MGLVALTSYAGTRAALAAQAGDEGRRALLEAEDRFADRDLPGARAALAGAARAFDRADGHLGALGPLRWVARSTPLLRVQVRAVDDLVAAGSLLAAAGDRLADAAGGVLEPEREDLAVSDALAALREIQAATRSGRADLEKAVTRIEGLRGVRLLGPLATARDGLLERVPEVRERARLADEGMEALVAFAGGDGPRRYLFLSQNPDEPRPTGGFVGTFGVLVADGERLRLERYEDIGRWRPPLPAPSVPVEEAPTPFRVPDRPIPQTIHNVNATAHFPAAAELAMSMWAQAGEEPVDGVVSFAPEFLARLLEVLGPVRVAAYDDTIDAANLIERLAFHTHRPEVLDRPDRKAFLAALAEVVLEALLDAPASRWEDLIVAIGDGFDAREAMAWAPDSRVEAALADREWDGTLPEALGDFVHLTEFAYLTKAGRGWQRTFDHEVNLRADGSGRSVTSVTVENTLPFDSGSRLNIDSLSYLVLYGPEGASFAADASDPPYALEPPLSGHPAVGILAAAPPLGSTTVTLAWNAPRLALERVDGRWEYRLTWPRLPGRDGDRLRLRVELPPGWRWAGDPPPREITVGDRDYRGTWLIVGG
jgi:hypothetical protein